jgi:hypothetical protein
MIYQEMYGYLTIEDPQVQKKVWPSLSPQTRDYINVFLTQISEAGDHFYYQKSKFYGLITEAEFENLCLVYEAMQSKDSVIELAFEEEFKQALISYEKKAALKAKMNQWRAELENEVAPSPIPMREQEPVFYSKRRMMEQDIAANHMPPRRYQNSLNDTGVSKGGCLLISVIAGILITIVLYFFFK